MSTADCDIWSFACTGHGQMHFAPSWDTGTLLSTDLVEACTGHGQMHLQMDVLCVMCSGVCQETNYPLHPPQKQILSAQIINFGADSIRGGSWCVGGFRTQYWGSLTRLA